MKPKCIRYFIAFLMLSLSIHDLLGQEDDIVRWHYTLSKHDAKIGDELDIYFRVEVKHHWFIYAIHQENEIIPPMEVYYNVKDCKLKGSPKSLYVVTISNNTEQGTVRTNFYVGISGGFKQRATVTGSESNLKANISYTVCSVETGESFLMHKAFDIEI